MSVFITALVIEHANTIFYMLYDNVICGLSGYTMFFHIVL